MTRMNGEYVFGLDFIFWYENEEKKKQMEKFHTFEAIWLLNEAKLIRSISNLFFCLFVESKTKILEKKMKNDKKSTEKKIIIVIDRFIVPVE